MSQQPTAATHPHLDPCTNAGRRPTSLRADCARPPGTHSQLFVLCSAGPSAFHCQQELSVLTFREPNCCDKTKRPTKHFVRNRILRASLLNDLPDIPANPSRPFLIDCNNAAPVGKPIHFLDAGSQQSKVGTELRPTRRRFRLWTHLHCLYRCTQPAMLQVEARQLYSK